MTRTFTAQDVLAQLTRAVTEVLGVDGAGVMVPVEQAAETAGAGGGLLRFAYAHGRLKQTITEVEKLQELLQDGPCRDSHDQGRVINLTDLAVEGSWPPYQARAADMGLHAVTAIPLRARGRGWGVLDLYRSQARRLSPGELAAAQTLANLATSYLVVTADRQAAEQAQAEVARRAMHDPLTGLPVRWVLLEQLTHALARLARHRAHIGVLFVDLDGLKYVNDTYGHAAGDDLLSAGARRIRAAVRPADVVARVGGDEFVVLLEDLTNPPDAAQIARRVLSALSAPHRIDDHTMTPSASIGLALTDSPGLAPETLIAHADSAMYRAKRAGRGRVDVVDAADYEIHRAEATTADPLLPALRKALAAHQLELHYQPIIDTSTPEGPTPEGPTSGVLRSGPVHAVEALLRWNRPGHGLVPAADFITTAERTGLIVDLGAWVLRTACAQLAAWDTTLGEHSPRHLFVNVSATELVDTAMAGRVADCLHATGLDPSRLVLEVTETSILTDHDTTTASVEALLDLGVALAIDDFGTGYSSLARLVDLPATTLKIDRSFTRDLHTSPAARAVVTAVLQLGASLGRTVVVEGVEDAPTQQALLHLGATHLQGYHLTRPTHPDQLTALLHPLL